jgi:hypothetical protein
VNQKVRDESFMKAGEEGKKNNVSIRSCQVRRKVRLSSREEKNKVKELLGLEAPAPMAWSMVKKSTMSCAASRMRLKPAYGSP